MFTRFKFLIKSTNQHGVHSPFVFDFVTKGLYNNSLQIKKFNEYHQLKNLSKKKKIILSKITQYFKINTIYFDDVSFSKLNSKNYALLFVKNLNKILAFSNLNSKHIIVVDAIHQDKKMYQNWKKVTQNPNITVSIDLFYFGLLFFRKEQAKENFTIRV
ncbi:hypothetical protein [Polaribacter sp.]|uniref:hypothetical protein n=1 Tax=Polaribacter sp. TaxID=1920175 RepID=UPI003F6D39B5